jgi:hypothetical protein
MPPGTTDNEACEASVAVRSDFKYRSCHARDSCASSLSSGKVLVLIFGSICLLGVAATFLRSAS